MTSERHGKEDSALLLLARTLAESKWTSQADVQQFVLLCLPSTNDLCELLKAHDSLSEYYFLSGGKFPQICVSPILHLLRNTSPFFAPQLNFVNIEDVAMRVVNNVLRGAYVSIEAQHQCIHALVDFLEKLHGDKPIANLPSSPSSLEEATTSLHLLSGSFEAMSSGPLVSFPDEDLTRVLKICEHVIELENMRSRSASIVRSEGVQTHSHSFSQVLTLSLRSHMFLFLSRIVKNTKIPSVSLDMDLLHKWALKHTSLDYVKKAFGSFASPDSVLAKRATSYMGLSLNALELLAAVCMRDEIFVEQGVSFLADILESTLDYSNTRSRSGVSRYFSAVASVLASFGSRYERFSSPSMDALVGFLTSEDSFLVRNSEEYLLRDGVIKSLCEISKSVGEVSVMQLIDVLSIALLQATAGPLNTGDTNFVVVINVITLLGKLAAAINKPAVTEAIQPILVDKLGIFQDVEIIYSTTAVLLVEIAAVGSRAVYKEILEVFLSLHKDPFEARDTHLSVHIPEYFFMLAKEISSETMKSDMLLRLLQHFNRLGTVLQTKVAENVNVQASSLAGHIGALLPAIGFLMSSRDPRSVDSLSTGFRRVFRRAWFHCVLYNFVEKGVWFEEWFEAVTQIAACAPVLVGKETYSILETETEINRLIHDQTNSADLEELKRKLASIVPSQSLHIGRLSFSRCLYLLSVYHLELIRPTSRKIFSLFLHLEDQSLFYEKVEYRCMRLLADSLFGHLVSEILESRDDDVGESVAIIVQLLLLKFCCRVSSVRDASGRYLVVMSKKFPFVLWDNRCVGTLLDLVDSVGTACREQISTEWSYRHPTLGIEIEFSESARDREVLFHSLAKLSSGWMSSASAVAPLSLQNVIQEYLLRFKDVHSGKFDHIGFSIGLQASDPGSALLSLDNEDDEDYSVPIERKLFVGSTRAHNFMMKMLFSGEISGIKEIGQKLSTVPELRATLLSSFRHLLKEERKFDDEEYPDFGSLMYRATALLIGEDKLDYELLHSVVWAPTRIFTQKAMEAAVLCWGWLTAAREEWELHVLAAIVSAWNSTVDDRVGLFSGDRRCSFDPGDFNSNKSADPEFCVAPHGPWIIFIAERQLVRGQTGDDFSDLFTDLLMKSLSDASLISTMEEAFGLRFRLLTMALRLVHSRPLQDTSYLRVLIYNAALMWFAKPPMYCQVIAFYVAQMTQFLSFYDPSDRGTLLFDSSLLLEFCTQLEVERSLLDRGKYDASIPETTHVPAPSLGDSEAPVAKTASISHFQRFGYSVTIKGATRSVVGRDTSVVDVMSNYDNRMVSAIDGMGNLGQAKNMVSLLFLLVSHEIDRINVWHNPRNTAGMQIVGNTKYTSFKQYSQNEWRKFVRTAWNVHPGISLNLYERFKLVAAKSEIEYMLSRNTESVLDVPEALSFIVAKLGKSGPTHHLLEHFALVSPMKAVSLLDKVYDHPRVKEYSVRVLRMCDPNSLVFYIPQIIQCLERDVDESLRTLLIDKSSDSPFFAHQLIWALRTEISDSNASGSTSSACEELLKEVVRNFTEEEEEYYNRVFNFYDSVVKISGDLRSLERPQRLGKLVEAVSELEVPEGIYLPTNPEYIIKYIIPTKCFPMQSAAKSPILVTFSVSRKQEDKTPSESDRVEVSECFKSCIFKMGDDCRQDKLAIQLIDVFKQVYKAHDLPLYLYPYKVLTTAHECGIIECVPNTVSRDQLGHRTEGGLRDYFLLKYGHKDGIAFQRARRNFVESMAAYSVVSFILNIKDRHNGNLLLDEEGHLIHIDFGFLFDYSPGGDINFESSPFKLTSEMLAVMGMDGTAKMSELSTWSESFTLFVDLCVKAFVAIRPHMGTILSLVSLMLDSEFPSFKPDTFRNLKCRFAPDMNEREAANFMIARVEESYENMRTVLYDIFQKYVEGIQS